MAIPCPDTQPHRAHAEDNAHGICGGVPDPVGAKFVHEMLARALDRAGARCIHVPVGPCRMCAINELADLSVFEPVLFPEET